MNSELDAIIIGAGAAGLTCALQMKRAGKKVLVLEASDRPGGRLRSDEMDGFILDRGFQVFLPAYPEAKRILDYEKLQLQPFVAGAMVRSGGLLRTVVDPWQDPIRAVQTLFSPVGSLKDKLLVARLRNETVGKELDTRANHTTTLEALFEFGFSEAMVDQFFKPFLGGIFLEKQLVTSAALFRFLFGLFAMEGAAIPKHGMGAISEQLAARLAPSEIRYGRRAVTVSRDSVVLDSGETLSADAIILATDARSASSLGGVAYGAYGRRVSCLYYSADKVEGAEPMLYLNADKGKVINNLCFPSVVSSAYAPPGKTLVSVSVLPEDLAKVGAGSEELLESLVRAELVEWFGPLAQKWRHLRTYDIVRALPDQSVDVYPPDVPAKNEQGVFLCGDYATYGSINGAMLSGRLCAEHVLSASVRVA